MKKELKEKGVLIMQACFLLIMLLSLPAAAVPVANWNFENNFVDDLNGHNGTGYNTPGFEHVGMYGSTALRLVRGSSEYVTVPDSASLRTNDFSVTAWTRVFGYQGNSRVLVNKYNHTTNAGYIVYVRGSDEKWIFKVGASDGGHFIVGPSAVKGQWVYIAATFQQTGTYSSTEVLGTMRLYIDGQLYQYISNVRYKPNSGSINFVIGADWTTASGYFNLYDGVIDDVEFHSNILTTAAIADIYNAADIMVEIMTLNVAYGAYDYAPSPYNFDRKDELIALIRTYWPDVVLLQECTNWADSGNTRLQEFADGLGMPYTYISKNGDWWKVAIISRFPLTNQEMLPAGANFYRNIAEARANVTSRRSVGVASQHFGWWGAPGWDTMTYAQKQASYASQKAYLLGSAYLGYYLNNNFVVGGDWNHNGTDAPYEQGVFHDAVSNMGFGLDKLRLYNSGAVPIDTFYVSPSAKLITLDCVEIANTQYSDHEPVLLQLLVKQ